MNKLKHKVKAFYETKRREKIKITALVALLLAVGVTGVVGYNHMNQSEDELSVSVALPKDEKDKMTSEESKKENTEETSEGSNEEHTEETTSDQNQETSGEGAQGSQSSTGHASTPASSTSQGNAGVVPSTSGGHVHNYVPVYQDVPAEGYWQFVPGQTVTESWVIFRDGVEMRNVTTEDKEKIGEYGAQTGLGWVNFQKVISQTPAQEVWVETKPAQTVLVGYQCTIDGSWK